MLQSAFILLGLSFLARVLLIASLESKKNNI